MRHCYFPVSVLLFCVGQRVADGVTSLGAGHVTDCPAYLSVTVNDRSAGEELCRYDALVSCPPQFNITVVVPRAPNHIDVDDRAFEVVLHDSKVEQRVFLSTLVVPELEHQQPRRPVDNSVQSRGNRLAVYLDHCSSPGRAIGLMYVPVSVCLSVCLSLYPDSDF